MAIDDLFLHRLIEHPDSAYCLKPVSPGMRLQPSDLVVCPLCDTENRADDWDHATMQYLVYEEDEDPEDINLSSIQESPGDGSWYCCPDCSEIVRDNFQIYIPIENNRDAAVLLTKEAYDL